MEPAAAASPEIDLKTAGQSERQGDAKDQPAIPAMPVPNPVLEDTGEPVAAVVPAVAQMHAIPVHAPSGGKKEAIAAQPGTANVGPAGFPRETAAPLAAKGALRFSDQPTLQAPATAGAQGAAKPKTDISAPNELQAQAKIAAKTIGATGKPDTAAPFFAPPHDAGEEMSPRAPLSSSTPAVEAAQAASSAKSEAGGAAQRSALPAQTATQQLYEPVRIAIQRGADHVQLRLEPAELGRVDIRFETVNGSSHVHIAADNGQTLDLLRRDQAAIERLLQQAGMDLKDGSLSLARRDDRDQGEPGSSFFASSAETADDETGPTRGEAQRLSAAEGLVDVNV